MIALREETALARQWAKVGCPLGREKKETTLVLIWFDYDGIWSDERNKDTLLGNDSMRYEIGMEIYFVMQMKIIDGMSPGRDIWREKSLPRRSEYERSLMKL